MVANREIYERAIKLWGIDSQLKMLAEECCELAQVALKLNRADRYSVLSQVAEEMADVEICIEQIKQFYMLSDMVDAKRCEKIDRLNGLVCKYEGGQL